MVFFCQTFSGGKMRSIRGLALTPPFGPSRGQSPEDRVNKIDGWGMQRRGNVGIHTHAWADYWWLPRTSDFFSATKLEKATDVPKKVDLTYSDQTSCPYILNYVLMNYWKAYLFIFCLNRIILSFSNIEIWNTLVFVLELKICCWPQYS